MEQEELDAYKESVLDTLDKKYIDLYVFGEVNEFTSREIIEALNEEDWETTEIDEIRIYINTDGGSLRDCFAIIDFIENIRNKYEIKITTFACGGASSAGFFIFLLGDERKMFKKTRIFVHEHITIGAEQTYGERVKADKNDEKVIYCTYVEYTMDRLKLTKTKAQNLLRRNNWLTDREIEKYNIATEVI